MAPMGDAFDLEDIAASALGALLGRFLAFWSCLMCGTVMAGCAILLGEIAERTWDWTRGFAFGSVDLPEVGELMLGLCFGFLAGLGTPLLPFYAAFLVGLLIYFFTNEAPGLYGWAVGAGVVGLNVVGAAWEGIEWWWSLLAMGSCLTMTIGLLFFAKMRAVALRVRAEEHFMGVAAENEARRRRLEEHGGDAMPEAESPGEGEGEPR